MNSRNRILIVDDNATNVDLLVEALEEFDVAVASDGPSAIEKAKTFRPDLVLLDVMMPGINGFDVCRELRKNPNSSGVKVIMVSARAMKTDRLAGYDAGADDYVTKPFDFDELLAKVQVYLRLKHVEEVDELKLNLFRALRLMTNNPLSGIVTPAETILGNKDMPRSEQEFWLDMIVRNGRQLGKTLDKIYKLALLKSGDLTLFFEFADLCAMIDEIEIKFNRSIGRRKLKLAKNLLESAPVRIDVANISTVIQSILDNAVRVSPDDGVITISLIQSESNYRLEIADSGGGIDPNLLPFIFEDFDRNRVNEIQNRSGLSMAIARYIISEHGGEINVRNNEQAGATFAVTLPAAQP